MALELVGHLCTLQDVGREASEALVTVLGFGRLVPGGSAGCEDDLRPGGGCARGARALVRQLARTERAPAQTRQDARSL